MKAKYILYPLVLLTIAGGIFWWAWNHVIWKNAAFSTTVTAGEL